MWRKKYKSYIVSVAIPLIFLLLFQGTAVAFEVEINLNPNKTVFTVGSIKEIELKVDMSAYAATFSYQWTLDGPGNLDGAKTEPSIFYIPPGEIDEKTVEAIVTIAVNDKTGQRGVSKSVIFTIKKKGHSTAVIGIGTAAVLGGGIAIVVYGGGDSHPTPTPTPTPTPAAASCCETTITSPQGTHQRTDASLFPVSNNVTLSWDRPGCVMTAQYWQSNELQYEYKNMVSGTNINIGTPGSGETEIKIYREGEICQGDGLTDYTWVWVIN